MSRNAVKDVQWPQDQTNCHFSKEFKEASPVKNSKPKSNETVKDALHDFLLAGIAGIHYS